MRNPLCPISVARTDSDNFDIRLMIANIISDLLEAPKSWKISYGVCENLVAFACQSCRDSGHILFRYTNILEAVRKLVCKRF